MTASPAADRDLLGGFARGESLEDLWGQLHGRYDLAHLSGELQLLCRGIFFSGIETALRTLVRGGRDRTMELADELEVAVDKLGLIRNAIDGREEN